MGLIKLEEALEAAERRDEAIKDEGEGVTDADGEKCKDDTGEC